MKFILLNSVVENRSTGQIMGELYAFLKEKGHQVKFCYGRGNQDTDNSDFIKIDSKIEVYLHVFLARITGLQGYYSNKATKKVIKLIEEYDPDVIILGNIHGYYLNTFELLNAIKKRKIITYYYMFDEFAFLGKCAFFGKCKKYLIECKQCPQKNIYPKSLFFDTSNKIFRDKLKNYMDFETLYFNGVRYTVEKSKESALFKKSKAKVYSFGWGIDTNSNFIPCNTDTLRKKLEIPNENKVVLAVAPYSNKRKGIKDYYYRIAKEMKDSLISFIHVGFDGEMDEVPENVIAIPFVKNQKELAKYFSMADLFVIPSISEGYPTVCLDSLSCGTPICGFDISGTPYVAPEPYGKFVEPFDVEALKVVIENTPRKDKDIIDKCRLYAVNNLDSKVINGKLLEQIMVDLKKKESRYE